MVNLNRQIAVARARQGGFSARVLPAPVGYQRFDGWSWLPETSLTSAHSPSGEITLVTYPEGPGSVSYSLDPSGGPYAGAACSVLADSADRIWANYGFIEGTPDGEIGVVPGDPYTIETYARLDDLTMALCGVAQSPYQGTTNQAFGGNNSIILVAQTTSPGATPPSALRVGFTRNNTVDGGVRTEFHTVGSAELGKSWHHYAFSCDGASGGLFFDGVQLATVSLSAPDYPSGLDSFVPVMGIGTGGGGYPNREIRQHYSRFTKRQLYTSNFTPPQL